MGKRGCGWGGAVTAWGTGMLSTVWGQRGGPHAELQQGPGYTGMGFEMKCPMSLPF